MKKTLLTISIIFFILFTPLLPKAVLFMLPNINVQALQGSIINGITAKSIAFKNIYIKNASFNHKLEMSAEKVEINNVIIKNVKTKIHMNHIQLYGELFKTKINGYLSKNKDEISFSGTLNRTPYPPQNIYLVLNSKKMQFFSKGSLGEISAKSDLTTNSVIWLVKNFNLGALIKNGNQTSKINGSGTFTINDSIEAHATFIDNLKNKIIVNLQKNGRNKLELNLPNFAHWSKNIKTIIGKIAFDSKAHNIDSNIKLNIQDHEFLFASNANHFTIIIPGEKPINLRGIVLENSANIKQIFYIKSILKNLAARTSKLYKATQKSAVNFSKFAIEMFTSEKKDLIKLQLLFDSEHPKQSQLTANIKTSEFSINNKNIKVNNLNISSMPDKSYLEIDAHINDQPLKINIQKTDYIIGHITGEKIKLPISTNSSLIINPDIRIQSFGNKNIVSGAAQIYGGNILSNKNDNVIDLPDNVTIIGKKRKVKNFDWLVNELDGKIYLATIKPIIVDNIAGLGGELSGKLTLNLVKKIAPKYEGDIELKNAVYLKNKHIKLSHAKATYANNVISNPFIDLKLVRQISTPSIDLINLATIDKKEIVGVTVKGTAEQPEIMPFSNKPGLSELQIISALETGSINGISPEQGVLSLFSAINDQNGSPIEKLKDALSLDEIYFSTQSSSTNDNLLNPSLGDASIVLSKTLFDKIKASYIASLHNKDYLITLDYLISPKLNINLYSSRSNQPQLSRNLDNYGINLLFYKSIAK